ncbi:hypothetical protein ACHQM5_010483 [Ranunculus cassubicifolius]
MASPPPLKAATPSPEYFNLIGEDIHQDILSRLPATTFASAACVSRYWSHLCNRILRPKLLSSISLNPNLKDAVDEVLNKVLGEPIRPHFAIASVGKKFSLRITKALIRSKLGFGIPIIVSEARGIIGNDSTTNEHKEVLWLDNDDIENRIEAYNLPEYRNRGIVLTVGYFPGLRVCAIPLKEGDDSQMSIDTFINNIKEYSVSPVGVIMFAKPNTDMEPVLEKIDYAMPEDTVIIGDESGHFLCNNGVDCTAFAGQNAAVALVFAKDIGKAKGDIRFSLVLSNGVSPIGPMYKGASVRMAKDEKSKSSTWLTARREGSIENLDGESILADIENIIEADDMNIDDFDLYIGVSKRRKCSIGLEKPKLISSTSFHAIAGGDEEYLYVNGFGIKTGDPFQFFYPDPQVALKSRNDVCDKLKALKHSNGENKVVCGGLMFSCCGRGESFLGCPNADSSAFLENFPGVPLSGTFCCGEIGRGYGLVGKGSTKCFRHVYSTLYLLILHTP